MAFGDILEQIPEAFRLQFLSRVKGGNFCSLLKYPAYRRGDDKESKENTTKFLSLLEKLPTEDRKNFILGLSEDSQTLSSLDWDDLFSFLGVFSNKFGLTLSEKCIACLWSTFVDSFYLSQSILKCLDIKNAEQFIAGLKIKKLKKIIFYGFKEGDLNGQFNIQLQKIIDLKLYKHVISLLDKSILLNSTFPVITTTEELKATLSIVPESMRLDMLIAVLKSGNHLNLLFGYNPAPFDYIPNLDHFAYFLKEIRSNKLSNLWKYFKEIKFCFPLDLNKISYILTFISKENHEDFINFLIDGNILKWISKNLYGWASQNRQNRIDDFKQILADLKQGQLKFVDKVIEVGILPKLIHRTNDVLSINKILSRESYKKFVDSLNQEKLKGVFSNDQESQSDKSTYLAEILSTLNTEEQSSLVTKLITTEVLPTLTENTDDLRKIVEKISDEKTGQDLLNTFVPPSVFTRLWNSIARPRTWIYIVLNLIFLCGLPWLFRIETLVTLLSHTFLTFLGVLSILLLSPVIFRVIGELLQGFGKWVCEIFLGGLFFSPVSLIRLGNSHFLGSVFKRLGYVLAFVLNPFAYFFTYLGRGCDELGKYITQFHWVELTATHEPSPQLQNHSLSAGQQPQNVVEEKGEGNDKQGSLTIIKTEEKIEKKKESKTLRFFCPNTIGDYPIFACQQRQKFAAHKKRFAEAAFTFFAIDENEKAGPYLKMFGRSR